MKKIVMVTMVMLYCAAARAQDPITEVIKAGIKKVIKAVDLKIQRLQNETIWLQNAQKVIENTMSDLHLKDIGCWVEKQKDLYADYFDELKKVKTAISYYHKVRDVIEKQSAIVHSYQKHFSLFKQDARLNFSEVEHISSVYAGIIQVSLDNMQRVTKVLTSFKLSMTDADRMNAIDEATRAIDKNYSDMQAFEYRIKMISVQRARDAKEVADVKIIYGIN